MATIKDKYINMAKSRNDFNTIDNSNFLLPDIDEMVQDDLMTEIYEKYVEDTSEGNATQKDILDAAFYTENPFSLAPGFYAEESAFVLKINTLYDSDKKYEWEESWQKNKYDGDTTTYNLDHIEDGGQSFQFQKGPQGVTYKGFKDYFKKIKGNTEGNGLSLRNIGMDTAELPHFEAQPIRKDTYDSRVLNTTVGEAKKMISNKIKVVYELNPYINGEVKKREDNDSINLLKFSFKDGKTEYREIVDRIKHTQVDAKQEYIYPVLVSTDDSKINTTKDGYLAQSIMKEKLEKADEIILVINANGVTIDKAPFASHKTFNSFYYADNTLMYLVDEWDTHYENLPITNFGYAPYGMDTYGRALGVIYVKEGSKWINLNKYILCKTEATEANPDFNNSPELQAIGAGLSDIFNQWSYDRNNLEWMDSFDKLNSKSYQDRLDLHKKLTGIDYTDKRNCALFIGDTLMLTPPENIRSLTQVAYERLPNMRSKGTMAKHIGHNQNMLEIDLYFYDEIGINGIPYKHTTPSGEVKQYKMNGLRSLIAQFKIAPYLPIENGYINDILGIEAVVLRNMNIQTVPGFPRLLKAIITLEEFNYRMFMPDIPVDDDMESTDKNRVAELQPMFAKCFDWTIFRYYYQRSLIGGDLLDALANEGGYGSYDYNFQYYKHKNAIGNWHLNGKQCNKGEVSFFIPNEEWLDQALQVKKSRETNPLTNDSHIEYSEEAKAFCGKLLKLKNNIKTLTDESIDNSNSKYLDVLAFNDLIKTFMSNHNPKANSYIRANIPLLNSFKKSFVTKNIDVSNKTMLYIDKEGKHNDIDSKDIRTSFITPLKNAIMNILNDADYMEGIKVDERVVYDSLDNSYSVSWEFGVKLNLSTITDLDFSTIKDSLSKNLDLKPDDIFEDNIIRIPYKMIFNVNTIMAGTQESYLEMFYQSNPMDMFNYIKSNDVAALNFLNKIDDVENEFDDVLAEDSNNAQNTEIDFYVQDYKNPANMPFVPYVRDVLATSMSTNLANTFTDVSIKAIEGNGPQYIGGQDIQLEIEIITDDFTVVTALNTLPTLASAMAKKYRKVLPAWPIKIKSDMTCLLGISEVLIDVIEVNTVAGLPGVYSINMRLTSVDRTQRQRESLRKLDITPQGGNIDYNGNSNLAIKNFFAIENALSKAELYPDLDLPTLQELGKLGYRYVKYSSTDRSYPDPDFYIVYAYPYTSMVIKKLVKDVISKNLLNPDGDESLHSFEFKDTMGVTVNGKVDALLGLQQNKVSSNSNKKDEEYNYTTIIDNINTQVREVLNNNNKLSDKEKDVVVDRLGLTAAIKHLVMCDVNDGWEIRPGWKAPLADEAVNDAVREYVSNNSNDAYAKEIKDIRAKALTLIDDILKAPLSYKTYSDFYVDEKEICKSAVNNMFSQGKGQELLELICPGFKMSEIKEESIVRDFSKRYFKYPNPMHYMVGMLYSSGCTLSGLKEYKDKISNTEWKPNHYAHDVNTTTPAYSQGTEESKYNKERMPYVHGDRIAGVSKICTSIDDAIVNGTVFGAWRLTKYSSPSIVSDMMGSEGNIIYRNKDIDKTYLSTNSGFIDPYYNALEFLGKEKEIHQYTESICLNKEANAEAFLRIMLTTLKKLILDGLFISEIDIIARDWSKLYEEELDLEKPNHNQGYAPGAPNEPDNNLSYAPGQTSDVETKNKLSSQLKELGFDIKEMDKMMKSIKESANRSFCARLAYPFLVASTKGARDVYSLLKARDYSALNSMTGYVENTNSIIDSKEAVLKFLAAMSGINMSLSKEGKNETSVSTSQMLLNSLMKDVYIKASEDPRAYILHSFYDMLVNDKRGRLVRAFPTYYIIFVDEGRKIGSWKLHDNFYNMNSISSINVVKSRKIAADTCTFVMNNTFNSYAKEPDVTTTQQYTDIYGLRDVFDSIFSPKTYFEKEKQIRLRKTVAESVVLQPGVRIHVRMGYSADGSKLPIVFNGKIAEVDVTDVANVVAQGDGHELTNPLNAFGQVEATGLESYQSAFTPFKDLRGRWAKGGETPRDLLARILTAKYGGWKKMVNSSFDGRWFNDNPFGIMHFGDPKFDNIFNEGEVIQNLYEISDTSLLKGVNELSKDPLAKKISPTINTSIQDKSFWDILHLCANSGLEHIGAIRDFGFRSTIFLGKPSNYYAYAYDLVDNKVIEKRKPFQQFHYFDSYTDILYNSIKASEAQMKTNAVGMWQSSDALWGREQSTVGPIYLDMNIYPEYQKSMTVDTGLLAAGNGGIDIGFINNLSEEWKLDANDNKVNKTTAWRVTANTLKNSVKDMYQGDVGVIGDPSVKPYDRIYLHDSHEDMMGMFEVEAVIHSMSAETGFTTSVMPDVIARYEDEYESAVQSIASSTFSTIGFVTSTLLADKLFGAAVSNKLVTSVAKSTSMYKANSKINQYGKDIYESVGMKTFLESKPNAKAFIESLGINPAQDIVSLERTDILIDKLAKTRLKTNEPFNNIVKSLDDFAQLDIDEYEKGLKSAQNNDRYGAANKKYSDEEFNKKLKDIKTTKTDLDNKIDYKDVNLKEFADELFKSKDATGKKELKEVLDLNNKKIVESWATGKIDPKTSIKDIAAVLNDNALKEAVNKKTLSTKNIDGLTNSFKKILIPDAKDVTAFSAVAKTLKGDGLIDVLKKVLGGALKFNWATLAIDLAINAVTFVMIQNAQEVFTRFLQGIQAIDVYPLKRYGKPLIAGMSGHKGSVMGYPVREGYDSIQGMILESVEAIKKWDGKFPLQWADGLINMFVDENVLEKLSEDWRNDLDIDKREEIDKEDLNQAIYSNIASSYAANANHAYSIMTRPRKSNFDTKEQQDVIYKSYEINKLSPSYITSDPKVLKLYYLASDSTIQKAMVNKRFTIAHIDKGTSNLLINFESGQQSIPVYINNMKENFPVIDMPLVHEDILYILKELLLNESLADIKIYFKSGLRVNDTANSWKSTGLVCTIEVKGGKSKVDKVEEVLESLKQSSNIINSETGIFKPVRKGDKFIIAVYAPIQSTEGR